MKTLTITLASVTAALMLVWLGWRLGERNRSLEQSVAEETLGGRVGQARQLSEIIDALNSGQTEEAKNFLLMQLYGHVMFIDLWYDHAGSGSQQVARDVLGKIAQHRAGGPTNYSTEYGRAIDTGVKARLDQFLTRPKKNKP